MNDDEKTNGYKLLRELERLQTDYKTTPKKKKNLEQTSAILKIIEENFPGMFKLNIIKGNHVKNLKNLSNIYMSDINELLEDPNKMKTLNDDELHQIITYFNKNPGSQFNTQKREFITIYNRNHNQITEDDLNYMILNDRIYPQVPLNGAPGLVEPEPENQVEYLQWVIENLKRHNVLLETNNDKIRDIIVRLGQQSTEHEQSTDRLTQQMDELRVELDNKKQEHDTQTQDIQTHIAKLDLDSIEKTSLNTEIQQLKQDYDDMDIKYKGFIKEIEGINTVNTQKLAEITSELNNLKPVLGKTNSLTQTQSGILSSQAGGFNWRTPNRVSSKNSVNSKQSNQSKKSKQSKKSTTSSIYKRPKSKKIKRQFMPFLKNKQKINKK